jgi:hypothetical protein
MSNTPPIKWVLILIEYLRLGTMGPLGPWRLVRGVWLVTFGSWPLLRTGNCLEVMVTVGNCPSMMLM